MKNKLKAIFVTLMTIAMTLGNATVVHAADATERTDIKVTNFKITDYSGNERENYSYNEHLKLDMTWDASAYGNTLKAGDYFNITLPEHMRFPQNHAATHFEVKDLEGNVVANAVVSPGANNGGSIKVTFTDYVENRHNIKGTVNLQANFSNVKWDENNTFTVIVGEHTASTTVKVDGPVGLNNEAIEKWAQAINGADDKAHWVVRINHMKDNLGGVTIKDSLSTSEGEMGDMKYITNSVEFWEVTYHEYGGLQKKVRKIDISNHIKFTDNDTKFEIDLSKLDLGDKQYRLEYDTTYISGTRLRNNVSIETSTKTVTD
ncbi:Ig-like domain-containing protein, partial [Kandleria sp.]|uniref:Ig-like domain-containing protein n=1 Tax=Kandleria sp. TaxID=2774291 RepID=UPI001B74691D